MQPFDRPNVDRLLSTTRSVRRRLDLERPVEEADLVDCIRLATYAPNASNAQRWRWLVVRDPERKQAIAQHYRAGIYEAMQALLERRRAEGDAAGVRHSEAVLQLAERLEDVPVLMIPCFQGEIAPESRYVDTVTLFASSCRRSGVSNSRCTAGGWPPRSPRPTSWRRTRWRACSASQTAGCRPV